LTWVAKGGDSIKREREPCGGFLRGEAAEYFVFGGGKERVKRKKKTRVTGSGRGIRSPCCRGKNVRRGKEAPSSA